MMSDTAVIAFDIDAATCTQRCRIVDSRFCEQSIIDGLKSGRFVTSTWINNPARTTIDDVASGEVIAIVESQQIDGEYLDFR